VNTEPGVNVDDEEEEDSDDISNPYESDHVRYDLSPSLHLSVVAKDMDRKTSMHLTAVFRFTTLPSSVLPRGISHPA